MLLNNKRVDENVPEPPVFYEAYLYLWSVWIEELNDWKYYGGWVAKQYHLTNYTDTTKDKDFRKDFATRKRIKFEILQYGRKFDMAYEERKMLAEADNGLGAQKSPKWYNKSNGGGKYANGYITNNPLDILWTTLEKKTFSTVRYQKNTLASIVSKGYMIQSKSELFDTDHLKIIIDGFESEPNPDEWEPIVVLKDAKPIYDKDDVMVGIEYCEGEQVIVGGNHRARGCANSKNGWAINAIEIPSEYWEELTFHQLRTLSDRLNPFDPKPSKSVDIDAKASWVINECKEKNLYRKNEKMDEIVDFKHISIVNEFNLLHCPVTIQNKIFTKVEKLLDNEKLQLNNDNLIDLSKAGLEENKCLSAWYDEKEKHLLTEYDWVYKISAHNYLIGKIIECIKRHGWGKKGIVLPYFKTLDQRESVKWESLQKEFNSYVKEILNPAGYKIVVKPLPLTLSEAKAEGFKNLPVVTMPTVP